MHFEAGKKRLLIYLCVIQVVIIIIIYQAFYIKLPLKQAIVQTWNDLAVRNNLRRTLFGPTFRINAINQHFDTNNKYNTPAKVSNRTVSFEITPDLVSNPFLLILVITTPKDFLRRHVVRTSWGGTHHQMKLNSSATFQGEKYDLNKLMMAFVVGRSNDDFINIKVEKEAVKYGDILRVHLKETYRGIVYKVLWAYSWALTINPRFILKADHDVYVSVRQLLQRLLNTSKPLLYSGHIHGDAPVSREENSPHYVSKAQLSRDTYPNYCAGPCYVMSKQFVAKVISSSSLITVFRVEDAYVGVLAENLGVTPQQWSEFLWSREIQQDHLKAWGDKEFNKYICIGDSLTTKSIQYLHFRYMQLN